MADHLAADERTSPAQGRITEYGECEMPEVIIEFVWCACDGDRHDFVSVDGRIVCENCGKEYTKAGEE